ncbi:Bug family tripartite tricarboxylate transporter substrate binding protein [Muricoccus radiodurans]|uniref:Bug family tripartite tricarboxylate transporter substrate binding protein n=1 Tax=Muricoccus radiodurans TaxID=2231721 RepID=UPI003CFB8020
MVVAKRRSVLTTLMAAAVPRVAFSQPNWPQRPIRVIVPYTAGGIADTVMRILQPALTERLGQPVVIENRTGASGAIAAQLVASSPADGYTLLFEGPSFATLPAVRRDMPFDYERAFMPVAQATTMPYVVGVRAGFPAQDVAGLIAEARRRPGEITYGTTGMATLGHFMGENLQLSTGVKLEMIAFRGGADVARELLGGRIDIGLLSYSSLLPAVERGVRVIASTAGRPMETAPGLPLIADVVPGFDMTSWIGFFAPTGTSADVVGRISEATRQALSDPEIRRRLFAAGSEPVESGPEDFAALVQRERETARRIVAATGLQI